MNSKHYEIYRKKRDALIQTIGEGKIIYETISYEERFHRSYRICITDNCILMVKPLDKEDYLRVLKRQNVLIDKMIQFVKTKVVTE